MATTISQEDILGLMPYKVLTTIAGDPIDKKMKLMKKKMSANLIAVKNPIQWGHSKGLLGKFQKASIFTA